MGSGLYQPSEFRDNCGFGLITSVEGQKSHELLDRAIRALNCMTHRGGIAADGKTGDGCGLLIQTDDAFFRAVASEQLEETLPPLYAVGMVFLSRDLTAAEHAKKILENELTKQGLPVIGWRKVPVNSDCLGPIAREQQPGIEQVFVGSGAGTDETVFTARLYMARRHANMALEQEKSFYICSLSTRVITYKGLMMPEDLANFYQDLGDPRFRTAICIFHQRFSTNTQPLWKLAQPFRMLAHNGEINTITGNRNWSHARRHKFKSELLPDLDQISPLVNRSGSDSSSLDNMLEILVTGGVDLFRAIRMLIPPAWQNVDTMDPDLRAFYEYNSMHMEPWDGPAGLVLTDGRRAICALDRNGLRPSRWVLTQDGLLTVASEAGVVEFAPQEIVARGRVGPGEVLAVDTETGEFSQAHDIDEQLKTQQPYKKWLKEHACRIRSTFHDNTESSLELVDKERLNVYQKMFSVSYEERDQLIRPLAESGQEAVGSMGDDTPIAVLSRQERSLYDYFRQQFAQVTNPPIDPLRESIVMSLETCLGREQNVFQETPQHAERVILKSPVLSRAKFLSLIHGQHSGSDLSACFIDLNYHSETAMKAAIETLCDQAVSAVKDGHVLLHLSDRTVKEGCQPLHAALAVGAIHHRLVETGLRSDANILVETATARDAHQFAVLLGIGATAIYPYLSYEVIHDRIRAGDIRVDPNDAHKNYRRGINKGLMKILSKMGISTMASYRAAQLFEAVGLASEVVELCFRGMPCRIEGAGFAELHAEQHKLADFAWQKQNSIRHGGLLKWTHDGEYHAFNPEVVQQLQKTVRQGDYSEYQKYTSLINQRPVTNLRDLMKLKPSPTPLDLGDVEPVEAILKRFDSAAMSLGALSPEAHEALAQAMNRLGGRSNSGEGGEDPDRFNSDRVSKIKQIASGRFGVTPHYLVNAQVLQIKVAQGAKPGEGGQLPGGKVNELIARLRYSVPGVTLISPPPHHDIYSIEDLAQLIFDLKQVNPEALVSVKLVSEPGVGTIAAGVAKAYADLITISGYDGGTAASPLTSIRHAGSPWELGLAEVHQALRANDLRGRVRLQTDGGLKTGLDVVKAAILGAESFGFGTAPMVALGCKYLRICHLNNCATGVATQDQHLRDHHFNGTVEMVMNYFTFVATEVREWLASVGCRSLDEVIGRTELLELLPGDTTKQRRLDLSPLLKNDSIPPEKTHTCQVESNKTYDRGKLAETILNRCLPVIENGQGGEFEFQITSCDRSVGARLSGEIARRYGNRGMPDSLLRINLSGSAGQSFGVWNVGSLEMCLDGEANDYVGKGMTGGKLVIRPPVGSRFESNSAAIIGNTCLYGATGGKLFAAGRAGERLAVRNSGAVAIVEGAGDHCCEYMTGGLVAVLGETGHNFGAGMTGGFAYVLDLKRDFVDRCNHELVDIHRIDTEYMEDYQSHLIELLDEYVAESGSDWGRELREDFYDYKGRFWLIKPKAASLGLLLNNTRGRPE